MFKFEEQYTNHSRQQSVYCITLRATQHTLDR